MFPYPRIDSFLLRIFQYLVLTLKKRLYRWYVESSWEMHVVWNSSATPIDNLAQAIWQVKYRTHFTFLSYYSHSKLISYIHFFSSLSLRYSSNAAIHLFPFLRWKGWSFNKTDTFVILLWKKNSNEWNSLT